MKPFLFKTKHLKHPFGYAEIFQNLPFQDYRESNVMRLFVTGVVKKLCLALYLDSVYYLCVH